MQKVQRNCYKHRHFAVILTEYITMTVFYVVSGRNDLQSSVNNFDKFKHLLFLAHILMIHLTKNIIKHIIRIMCAKNTKNISNLLKLFTEDCKFFFWTQCKECILIAHWLHY